MPERQPIQKACQLEVVGTLEPGRTLNCLQALPSNVQKPLRQTWQDI